MKHLITNTINAATKRETAYYNQLINIATLTRINQYAQHHNTTTYSDTLVQYHNHLDTVERNLSRMLTLCATVVTSGSIIIVLDLLNIITLP